MKKVLKICLVGTIACASLVALSGCGRKSRLQRLEDTLTNFAEEMNSYANELESYDYNTVLNAVNEVSNQAAKPVDRTPVDIKNSSSYFFTIDGKKYSAGDKISTLESSGYHLNKTGAEKELQPNGYLLMGDSIVDSNDKTVFYATPFNNTKENVKGGDATIGSFSIDSYSYEKLNKKVEIVNGITIGTSLEDIEAIFGEPTSKTDATEYNGPSYTYSVTGEYKSFTFRFDKENKVNSIRWQAFMFQN